MQDYKPDFSDPKLRSGRWEVRLERMRFWQQQPTGAERPTLAVVNLRSRRRRHSSPSRSETGGHRRRYRRSSPNLSVASAPSGRRSAKSKRRGSGGIDTAPLPVFRSPKGKPPQNHAVINASQPNTDQQSTSRGLVSPDNSRAKEGKPPGAGAPCSPRPAFPRPRGRPRKNVTDVMSPPPSRRPSSPVFSVASEPSARRSSQKGRLRGSPHPACQRSADDMCLLSTNKQARSHRPSPSELSILSRRSGKAEGAGLPDETPHLAFHQQREKTVNNSLPSTTSCPPSSTDVASAPSFRYRGRPPCEPAVNFPGRSQHAPLQEHVGASQDSIISKSHRHPRYVGRRGSAHASTPYLGMSEGSISNVSSGDTPIVDAHVMSDEISNRQLKQDNGNEMKNRKRGFVEIEGREKRESEIEVVPVQKMVKTMKIEKQEENEKMIKDVKEEEEVKEVKKDIVESELKVRKDLVEEIYTNEEEKGALTTVEKNQEKLDIYDVDTRDVVEMLYDSDKEEEERGGKVDVIDLAEENENPLIKLYMNVHERLKRDQELAHKQDKRVACEVEEIDRQIVKYSQTQNYDFEFYRNNLMSLKSEIQDTYMNVSKLRADTEKMMAMMKNSECPDIAAQQRVIVAQWQELNEKREELRRIMTGEMQECSACVEKDAKIKELELHEAEFDDKIQSVKVKYRKILQASGDHLREVREKEKKTQDKKACREQFVAENANEDGNNSSHSLTETSRLNSSHRDTEKRIHWVNALIQRTKDGQASLEEQCRLLQQHKEEYSTLEEQKKSLALDVSELERRKCELTEEIRRLESQCASSRRRIAKEEGQI